MVNFLITKSPDFANSTRITSHVKLYQYIGRGVRRSSPPSEDTEAHTVYSEHYNELPKLLKVTRSYT
jgi:hypothetical protein